MTLNTQIKDWLATNAGTGTCFSGSGVTYNDADGISHTGRTGDVLNAFFTAHQVAEDSAIIIANTNYTQLKSINSGQNIEMSDVGWVYANDGGTGSTATFCKSACVPTWTCRQPLDGYEINSCDGTVRQNPACNPCTPVWGCEMSNGDYTGWETDGCGNRRMNSACAPITNGTLNTDTNPRRAYIIIDGIDSMNVTPAVLSLTPGLHRLEYILDGYETLIKDITMHQGEYIITVDTLVPSASNQNNGGGAIVALAIGAALLKSVLS